MPPPAARRLPQVGHHRDVARAGGVDLQPGGLARKQAHLALLHEVTAQHAGVVTLLGPGLDAIAADGNGKTGGSRDGAAEAALRLAAVPRTPIAAEIVTVVASLRLCEDQVAAAGGGDSRKARADGARANCKRFKVKLDGRATDVINIGDPGYTQTWRFTVQEGAMFPWQSGSDGEEETQERNLNPRSQRWVPDHSYLQRHVGSAIAY